MSAPPQQEPVGERNTDGINENHGPGVTPVKGMFGRVAVNGVVDREEAGPVVEVVAREGGEDLDGDAGEKDEGHGEEDLEELVAEELVVDVSVEVEEEPVEVEVLPATTPEPPEVESEVESEVAMANATTAMAAASGSISCIRSKRGTSIDGRPFGM